VSQGETRESDVVARVGGDEFPVLSAECGPEGAGIGASLGFSMRVPSTGLTHSWAEAVRAMHAEKERRRAKVGHVRAWRADEPVSPRGANLT
jgi:GGDEF domain-containing protein